MKNLLTTVGLLCVASAMGSPHTNHPPTFHQKVPWAVGFSMKGTVTNVETVDDRIHFRLKGWFWFHQYPEGGTNQQVIKVDCERGISVAVTPKSFVAMTSDWRGGSVQNDKSRLTKILELAAERGTVTEFSLLHPKLDFGTNGLTLTDAEVWRITDTDLR